MNYIPLTQIDPDPDQPRRRIDPAGLSELTDSIRSIGVAQPIMVRPVDSRYMIIHGERRWRASMLASLDTIPAVIRDDVTEQEARLIALIENIQRRDLSPIEEAAGYQALLATGMTQAALGNQIGKSQSYIAGKLRLLKIPAGIQVLLDRGRLSEGHVKQLLRLDHFYAGAVDSTDYNPADLHLSLFDLAPLSGWYIYARAVDDVTRAALLAQIEECAGRADNPAWHMPALWIGAICHHHGAPVTQTKQIVDLFFRHVVNAAVYVHNHDAPGSSRLSNMRYFSSLADLHHAGLSEWADPTAAGAIIYERGYDTDSALMDIHPMETVPRSHLLPTDVQTAVKVDAGGELAQMFFENMSRDIHGTK